MPRWLEYELLTWTLTIVFYAIVFRVLFLAGCMDPGLPCRGE